MFRKLLDDVRAGKYGPMTPPDQELEPKDQPDRGPAASEPTAAPATKPESDKELADHLIEEIEDEQDNEEGQRQCSRGHVRAAAAVNASLVSPRRPDPRSLSGEPPRTAWIDFAASWRDSSLARNIRLVLAAIPVRRAEK